MASTTTLAAGNSPASVAVANPGPITTGVRFEVTSVVTAPSQITVTNTTNGYSFVWRKLSGAFVAGDYIDWFYTDPREEAHTSGTAPGSAVSPTGADFCELVAASNTISAQRTAGTGSANLLISWKPRYLSL